MEKTATRVIDVDAAIVRQRGRGRLLVVKGQDRGESISVGDQPITLGSGSGSDVLLSDPTVSRRHLSVASSEGGVIVRDLGSTNGSFVQGSRFQELTLGFGAEVTIGHTVLKYVPDEEAIDPMPAEEETFGSLVGRDPKLRKLFRLLGDVANSEATVLLEGETGTGKELLAEEIHRHSARRDGPFVVFDCGAVPAELIESALFGHVRGAFTSAVSDRRGAFAEADGGTLFLDEIGELSPEVQPVLLRALDKHAIRPVGGASYETVSVRVVAATNRNLRNEMTAKRFREDLYYRLAVVRVSVPALRQRLDDIPLLVEYFVRQFCGGRNVDISAADIDRLKQHAWPGNVRELRNIIERACALRHGDRIEIDETFETRPITDAQDGEGAGGGAGVDIDLPFKLAKARVIDAFERAYVQALLKRHKGNLSAAARSAEVDRKHFRELLRKHGLRETPDA
jgi:DNA-binding NtrC family response regulator